MAINLTDYRKEYDPMMGDVGRGKLVSEDEAKEILLAAKEDGYEPMRPVGLFASFFPIHALDGKVIYHHWHGVLKEEDGKHYCISVETLREIKE